MAKWGAEGNEVERKKGTEWNGEKTDKGQSERGRRKGQSRRQR